MSSETDLGERFVLDACALIAYFNDEVGAKSLKTYWNAPAKTAPGYTSRR